MINSTNLIKSPKSPINNKMLPQQFTLLKRNEKSVSLIEPTSKIKFIKILNEAKNHKINLENNSLIKSLQNFIKKKKISDTAILDLADNLAKKRKVSYLENPEENENSEKKQKTEFLVSNSSFLSENAQNLAKIAKEKALSEIEEIRKTIHLLNEIYSFNDQLNLFKKLNFKKFERIERIEENTEKKGETKDENEKIKDEQNYWAKAITKNHKLRRSEHISSLSYYARQLPLWMSIKMHENIPKLTGNANFENYICCPGEKVACHISHLTNNDSLQTNFFDPQDPKLYPNTENSSNFKLNKSNSVELSPSKVLANESNDNEECWYLGEIISYDQNTNNYLVDDYDGDSNERWRLSYDKVKPLPNYKIDDNSLAIKYCSFKPDDEVLALYPQTTCFYKALVYESPKSFRQIQSKNFNNLPASLTENNMFNNNQYMITFEDKNFECGWSPPMPVEQRYVIGAFKTKNQPKCKLAYKA